MVQVTNAINKLWEFPSGFCFHIMDKSICILQLYEMIGEGLSNFIKNNDQIVGSILCEICGIT